MPRATKPTVTPRYGPMPNESQAPPFWMWAVVRDSRYCAKGFLCVTYASETGCVPSLFASRSLARERAAQSPGRKVVRVRIELESGWTK